jgi:hypothetical protein
MSVSFRNALTAAEARSRALEDELGELRGADERARQLSRRLDALEDELGSARRELATLRGQPPARGAAALALAAFGALGMGGAAILLRLPLETMEAQPTREAADGELPRSHAVARRAERLTAQSDSFALRRPAWQRVEPRWLGRVLHARGVALPRGVACELSATAASGGLSRARLSCGDHTLYDSDATMTGVSTTRGGVFEIPDGPSGRRIRYQLAWDDLGDRVGERPQITVSTAGRRAVVFRETTPALYVEVELEALSAPRDGASLYHDLPLSAVPTVVGGTVTRAGLGAPVPIEARCRVEARLHGLWQDAAHCRVSLSCGPGRILYDAFARCALDPATGAPIALDDREPSARDGDAALMLDLRDRRANWSDGGRGSLELRLDDAP